MIHSEKQILDIAQRTLEAINFSYNKDNGLEARFEPEEELLRSEKEQKIPAWIIDLTYYSFSEEKMAFLTISDITGEPLYLQISMVSIIQFKKNDKGEIVIVK